jgi:hypothetical protein
MKPILKIHFPHFNATWHSFKHKIEFLILFQWLSAVIAARTDAEKKERAQRSFFAE